MCKVMGALNRDVVLAGSTDIASDNEVISGNLGEE